ncbi:MAG: addiction module protein [Acidobacteriota bacterium]
MIKTVSHLLADALELTETERTRLAQELSASVGHTGDKERSAWLDELERRSRAALDGEPRIPWAKARAEIEARLKGGGG